MVRIKKETEMTHRIRSLSIAALALSIVTILTILLPSCQKSPINGDLDGQWQVMEVSPEPDVIVTENRIYYCFSLHVCQLTQYGGRIISGNLKYANNEIRLEFAGCDDKKSQMLLRQYGINSNPVTFSVEQLDKKSLILRDGDTIVTLRRF